MYPITSTQLTTVFFAIYVLIAVVIGVYASRRESEDGFMIADRRVKGLQMVATITAGLFDGAALSIYMAYVYQYGFSAIWFFIGLALGFLLFRHFAARIKTQADTVRAYSMSEYFYRLLGRRVGLMFSLFLVVQFFGYLTVNFIIAGKVLAATFPGMSYPVAVSIGAGVILTYLLLAGFKAVVRTDLFQFIIMIVMTVAVASYLTHRTTIAASDLSLTQMGLGNVIGFLIIAGLGVMVAPDLWQRAFAANDKRTLKRGFAYGSLILPLLAAIITVVGLATRQQFPGIQPEDALVVGFGQLLPFGLKEFGMVLLYAVALSSSDTVTFVVASILTRDLQNYTVRFSEQSMRTMTRWIMIGFVLAAMAIAASYQKILDLAFSLASLNLALFPVVFASFYWTLKRRAVFWSLVLAFGSVLAVAASGSLTPETASLSLPVAVVSLILLQWLVKDSGGLRVHESR